MVKVFRCLGVLTALLAPWFSMASDVNVKSKVVSADSLRWGYLNPLRGDKSPGAANLWGDRTANAATGMLVRFKKGFASPPHIHNVSYRGIVIKGLVHNDDPKADFMWLSTGSYWTQPAGEDHITAANADSNLIYLEIDSGPYLVKPSDQQFDNGERPLNVHASNLVWLTQNDTSLLKGENISASFLWQDLPDRTTKGYLIKLADGTKANLLAKEQALYAVVIKGYVRYQSADLAEPGKLRPGSFFSSDGNFRHTISAKGETILYIRADKPFELTSQ